MHTHVRRKRSALLIGLGMVVICAAEDKDMLVKSLQGSGETVSEIGTVTSNGQINIAHADQSWRGKK